MDAKAKAEEAIKLGKILKYKANRVTTQTNTLARVVKKLDSMQLNTNNSSPSTTPAANTSKPANTPKPAASAPKQAAAKVFINLFTNFTK